MRASAIITLLTGASLTTAAASMRVDGVLVYGRVHDVSLTDIRHAIDESTRGAQPELTAK
jgi:hypothetical protein